MPELRKDLVTEGWVIIATERAKRPHEFSHAPSFLVFCPFASRFPFELCVMPKR